MLAANIVGPNSENTRCESHTLRAVRIGSLTYRPSAPLL